MVLSEGGTVARKTELFRMTWTEAAEAFEKNPVVLLPMGSIEQHGPHCPVGDYRYMTEVCRRIAEKTDAIVVPTIPWGYSDAFEAFPGTLTVRPETLKNVVLDVLDGLLRHGLDHIVLVCGHKGNMSTLEQVARIVRKKHGVRLVTVEPLTWNDAALRRELYKTDKPPTGHGSDPMCSIAIELFPEDVRMDLAEEGHPYEFWGLPLGGGSGAKFEGYPVSVYSDWNEVAPNGVIGDPFIANAEVGRRVVEHMIDVGVRFVSWFKDQDTSYTPVRSVKR